MKKLTDEILFAFMAQYEDPEDADLEYELQPVNADKEDTEGPIDLCHPLQALGAFAYRELFVMLKFDYNEPMFDTIKKAMQALESANFDISRTGLLTNLNTFDMGSKENAPILATMKNPKSQVALYGESFSIYELVVLCRGFYKRYLIHNININAASVPIKITYLMRRGDPPIYEFSSIDHGRIFDGKFREFHNRLGITVSDMHDQLVNKWDYVGTLKFSYITAEKNNLITGSGIIERFARTSETVLKETLDIYVCKGKTPRVVKNGVMRSWKPGVGFLEAIQNAKVDASPAKQLPYVNSTVDVTPELLGLTYAYDLSSNHYHIVTGVDVTVGEWDSVIAMLSAATVYSLSKRNKED